MTHNHENESPPSKGMVYLVGAGPGDPGLITLRGIQCLRRADVILYDYLVNPIITQHAAESAECICLGRHGGHQRFWSQDEINRQLLELASAGKSVVRLKGGDPAVFARGGEEVAFLLKHGVPCEVVPGITAALAAGSHAGIPITHRDHASAVALITGREKPGKSESSLDFAALAKFPGTLVFYMGVTTANEWTSKLIEHGKSPGTPVALVRRCSLPDQQMIRCRLDKVVENLTPYSRFPPPVICIVGKVTDESVALNWFQHRRLYGQTVLVTRPAHQASALGDQLAEQGANVLYQPAIAIEPVADWAEVDSAIQRLGEFDWIVFSSANGVRAFLDRVLELGKDLRTLGDLRIAAVGTATAKTLYEFHLRADLVPQDFCAESLAAEMADAAKPGSVLLVRASRGREVLGDSLSATGNSVEQVVAYQSTDVDSISPEIKKVLEAGDIDWVTVTSSAIARSLSNLLGDRMGELRLVSISPITSATLRELGHEPTLEATTYKMQGIVEALVETVEESAS